MTARCAKRYVYEQITSGKNHKKGLSLKRIKIFFGCAVMAMAIGCGGGSSSETATNVPVVSNQSPVAVIDSLTSDYIAGKTVEVTSASSTDGDGDTLSIQWELDSPRGSYALLKEVGTNVVEFEPDMAGTFTIRLEVSDGRGGVDWTSLNITPSLPTPDALPLFASTALLYPR